MNEKHLLWWILKAIDEVGDYGMTRSSMLSEATWADSPDWVFPAIKEKYAAFGAPAP